MFFYSSFLIVVFRRVIINESGIYIYIYAYIHICTSIVVITHMCKSYMI